MAGDWIKLRVDLPDDLEVIGMASDLGITEDEVVGKLVRTWSWIQAVSRDGHAPSVTSAWLDRRIGRDGWSAAMIRAGWLIADESGLTFPNFDAHMSEGAKRRALARRRKAESRSRGHASVTQVSRSERDKNGTREEKRREEKENPPTPLAGGDDDDGLPDLDPTRVTIGHEGQGCRWSPEAGLLITRSALAGLRKAFPGEDVEALLAGWEAWRQGERSPKSRNPLSSIEAWIRNRQGKAAAPAAPQPTEDELLAECRAVNAEMDQLRGGRP